MQIPLMAEKSEIIQRTIGDKITLDILKGSEQMQKEVAILERPNSPPVLADLVNSQSNLVRRFGILAMTLDEHV